MNMQFNHDIFMWGISLLICFGAVGINAVAKDQDKIVKFLVWLIYFIMILSIVIAYSIERTYSC